jgi:hypothetical protein
MKVAVAKFVGLNERKATDSLKKLSLYYGFNYRFCNIAKGNEKGHVENAVDYVRRKAFSCKYNYIDYAAAEEQLGKKVEWVNNNNPVGKPSANELFKEEIKYLLPIQPEYDTSIVTEVRVDKLSTITLMKNRYSVPDYLVGKYVTAKIYLKKINIYYNFKILTEHNRSFGKQTWSLKIEHYRKTLFRKPGAIKNSMVMEQLNIKLKKIFNEYFTNIPRDFLSLLDVVAEHGIEKVEKVIKKLSNNNIAVNLDNIQLIINKTVNNNYINISMSNSIEKIVNNQLNEYDKLANTHNSKMEAIM